MNAERAKLLSLLSATQRQNSMLREMYTEITGSVKQGYSVRLFSALLLPSFDADLSLRLTGLQSRARPRCVFSLAASLFVANLACVFLQSQISSRRLRRPTPSTSSTPSSGPFSKRTLRCSTSPR